MDGKILLGEGRRRILLCDRATTRNRTGTKARSKGKRSSYIRNQAWATPSSSPVFLPLMEALGARVIFEVPEALYRLFKGSKFAGNLVGKKDSPPPFDYHFPLMDTPRLFNTTLETIHSCDLLRDAHSKLQKEWADRICPSENFRLGIV